MLYYRDVVGYEDLFEISFHGVLRSKRTSRILRQHKHPHGYMHVSTKVKGRNILFRIHRLVASAWVDNPENKPYVNHLDGDKMNNSADNLEWCTAAENSKHAYEMGLIVPPKNEFKLDEEVRQLIKGSYKPRDKFFGARPLARKYGVSHKTILRCLK